MTVYIFIFILLGILNFILFVRATVKMLDGNFDTKRQFWESVFWPLKLWSLFCAFVRSIKKIPSGAKELWKRVKEVFNEQYNKLE